MKAVIFARVSSKDQEDGHSLDAQIQSCFEYAIKKEFKVLEQFRVVESSTANGRPEFSKMVDFVKKQQEKVVVLCYCVDRLQRDFDEQYFELQKLIKLGKLEIHFIKNEFIEHKDMDSSAKFRKNLDVLLANDYRNKISDNVKRSNRKKLEEGTILGDSPIGYLNTKRIDKKKEKVEVCIDPERGHLVKKMFEEYATGLHSMEDLRLMANEEGLRSKKSKGECSYFYHLNENAVLSQIEDVLKGMKIPQHILKDVADELKKSSDKEHQHQVSEGVRLQQQYQTLQTRIKRARELYLDASIAKEEFDEMMTGLQVERQNVEARLQRLSNADSSFNKNVMTIFELASKAHDLFKSSELEEKRRIIALVFPNLEMNAAKLVFTLRKPFDMMMNVSHRQEWLPGKDSNLRPSD